MNVQGVARRRELLERRCPDRVVVLIDGCVHTLRGPAACLWIALDVTSTIGGLSAELGRSLGEPVSPDEVDALIKMLAEAGLVSHGDSAV